jgi:glucose/arabinose dehydrogenase
MSRSGIAVLTATIVAALVGCEGAGGAASPAATTPAGASPPSTSVATSPASTSAARPAQPPTPRIAGTVASEFTSPWGVAFLPDRTALVSERDTGRIKRVSAGGSVSTVGTVPGVDPGGEGGLMGLAVAADFTEAPYVYAYFTAADDNRIVRMPYEGGRLGEPDVLVTGIPKAGVHNGGRLVFGPDGMLYAGTGEAGDRPLSQDRGSLGGKILRMTPQGRAPGDNPFRGSLVYSLGHRNVQGLAFDPQGRLWASEFGQNTWDELNLIRPGRNYGWPEVEGRGGPSRYEQPVAQWSTDDASPSGIAVAGGSVWMAGLRGARLWRIPIESANASVGSPADFLTGEYGRLRTVQVAPDGSLWLTTSNTDGRGSPRRGDDRILRLVLS